MATKRLKELLEARKSSARENSGLLSFEFHTMLNLLTSMTNLRRLVWFSTLYS